MGEDREDGEWAKIGEIILESTADKAIWQVGAAGDHPTPVPGAFYCGNTSQGQICRLSGA